MDKISLISEISGLENKINDFKILAKQLDGTNEFSSFQAEALMEVFAAIYSRDALINLYVQKYGQDRKFIDYSKEKEKLRNFWIHHFLAYIKDPSAQAYKF